MHTILAVQISGKILLVVGGPQNTDRLQDYRIMKPCEEKIDSKCHSKCSVTRRIQPTRKEQIQDKVCAGKNSLIENCSPAFEKQMLQPLYCPSWPHGDKL